MTKVVINIFDDGEELKMEGHIPPEALDLPPTPAVIIGAYIGANSEQICKDAIAWFGRKVKEEDAIDTDLKVAESNPKIILPHGHDDGIVGAPV